MVLSPTLCLCRLAEFAGFFDILSKREVLSLHSVGEEHLLTGMKIFCCCGTFDVPVEEEGKTSSNKERLFPDKTIEGQTKNKSQMTTETRKELYRVALNLLKRSENGRSLRLHNHYFHRTKYKIYYDITSQLGFLLKYLPSVLYFLRKTRRFSHKPLFLWSRTFKHVYSSIMSKDNNN